MVKVLFPTKKDVVVPKTFFIISLRKKNTVCLHKSLDIFVLFLGEKILQQVWCCPNFLLQSVFQRRWIFKWENKVHVHINNYLLPHLEPTFLKIREYYKVKLTYLRFSTFTTQKGMKDNEVKPNLLHTIFLFFLDSVFSWYVLKIGGDCWRGGSVHNESP